MALRHRDVGAVHVQDAPLVILPKAIIVLVQVRCSRRRCCCPLHIAIVRIYRPLWRRSIRCILRAAASTGRKVRRREASQGRSYR